MVKYINNTRGKSDKHQQHELKYATSHRQETLEKWYERMTQPRNPIGRPRKVKVPRPPKVPKGRDPSKVEAKKQRDKLRVEAYYQANPSKIRTYEVRMMVINDINIQ